MNKLFLIQISDQHGAIAKFLILEKDEDEAERTFDNAVSLSEKAGQSILPAGLDPNDDNIFYTLSEINMTGGQVIKIYP